MELQLATLLAAHVGLTAGSPAGWTGSPQLAGSSEASAGQLLVWFSAQRAGEGERYFIACTSALRRYVSKLVVG